MTLGEVKRSNIIKFQLPCQFQRLLYQTLCVFLQIKENILNRFFILLLGSCPRGGTWGAGGSKTLAWGFVMAPHGLRILVLILTITHGIKLFRSSEIYLFSQAVTRY